MCSSIVVCSSGSSDARIDIKLIITTGSAVGIGMHCVMCLHPLVPSLQK